MKVKHIASKLVKSSVSQDASSASLVKVGPVITQILDLLQNFNQMLIPRYSISSLVFVLQGNNFLFAESSLVKIFLHHHGALASIIVIPSSKMSDKKIGEENILKYRKYFIISLNRS